MGILLLGFIGLVGLTNWMARALRPHYVKSIEESLVDQVTLLASSLSQDIVDGEINVESLSKSVTSMQNREFKAQIYDMTKKSVNSRIYVTDSEGIVLFDSYENSVGYDYSQWNDVARTLRGEYGSRSTRDNPADDRSSVLFVAAPILLNDSIIGSVTIGKPANSVNFFIEDSQGKLFEAVIVTGIMLAIFVFLFTSWVTIPIRKITAHAQLVAGTSIAPQIIPDEFGKGDRNEFRTLAVAIEEMRKSLEGKKYVEQYVQSLTHEIKSPLSAIRGAVELIDDNMPAERRDRFLTNISTETSRITNIIDRMLQLASLENRQGLSDSTLININTVVSDAIRTLESRSALKNISIVFTPDDQISIEGEKFLIEHVVINLLTNAINFTPESGNIDITLNKNSDQINLSVKDSGSGIPDYAIERVFDRFYSLVQPDTGRKSSGLGLPFVREAIELHNGTVTINNHVDGGAVAIVNLPLN